LHGRLRSLPPQTPIPPPLPPFFGRLACTCKHGPTSLYPVSYHHRNRRSLSFQFPPSQFSPPHHLTELLKFFYFLMLVQWFADTTRRLLFPVLFPHLMCPAPFSLFYPPPPCTHPVHATLKNKVSREPTTQPSFPPQWPWRFHLQPRIAPPAFFKITPTRLKLDLFHLFPKKKSSFCFLFFSQFMDFLNFFLTWCLSPLANTPKASKLLFPEPENPFVPALELFYSKLFSYPSLGSLCGGPVLPLAILLLYALSFFVFVISFLSKVPTNRRPLRPRDPRLSFFLFGPHTFVSSVFNIQTTKLCLF